MLCTDSCSSGGHLQREGSSSRRMCKELTHVKRHPWAKQLTVGPTQTTLEAEQACLVLAGVHLLSAIVQYCTSTGCMYWQPPEQQLPFSLDHRLVAQLLCPGVYRASITVSGVVSISGTVPVLQAGMRHVGTTFTLSPLRCAQARSGGLRAGCVSAPRTLAVRYVSQAASKPDLKLGVELKPGAASKGGYKHGKKPEGGAGEEKRSLQRRKFSPRGGVGASTSRQRLAKVRLTNTINSCSCSQPSGRFIPL